MEDSEHEIAAVLFAKAAQRLVPGKYEITLVHRYYSDPPVTGEQLNRALEGHELRAPRVSVLRLPDDASFNELRIEWADHARSSLLRYIASWSIEIALLVGALFGVFRTVVVYRKRLLHLARGRLLSPVAVQAILFVVAFFALASATGALLIGLVAPILLCVWVYELGLYLLVQFRRRAANEL